MTKEEIALQMTLKTFDYVDKEHLQECKIDEYIDFMTATYLRTCEKMKNRPGLDPIRIGYAPK